MLSGVPDWMDQTIKHAMIFVLLTRYFEGGVPVLVVTNPEYIKEVLVQKFANFSERKVPTRHFYCIITRKWRTKWKEGEKEKSGQDGKREARKALSNLSYFLSAILANLNLLIYLC